MQPLDPFRNLPTLETERLILRKLRLSDAEAIFAYASDPGVAATTTWLPHPSSAQSRRLVERIQRAYRVGEAAPWGVEHRSEGVIIGTCGFGTWERQHRRAEIGYALSRPYWGRGYMTEAVRVVLAFGFQSMQLNRIQAMCLPENLPSERVMAKVGMRYEGLLRQYSRIKGSYRDLKLYAIVRGDFEQQANDAGRAYA